MQLRREGGCEGGGGCKLHLIKFKQLIHSFINLLMPSLMCETTRLDHAPSWLNPITHGGGGGGGTSTLIGYNSIMSTANGPK